MTPIAQAAAVAVIALGTGASAVGVAKRDLPDLAVPDGAWGQGVVLDGQAFSVTGTVIESGEELDPTVFSFADGKFQSSRCQVYCDFGWQDYRTRKVGDVLHFTATTNCPSAPHTVVWHGTIAGDDIAIAGTWTTRRWYWTRQITLDGTAVPAMSAPVTGEG